MDGVTQENGKIIPQAWTPNSKKVTDYIKKKIIRHSGLGNWSCAGSWLVKGEIKVINRFSGFKDSSEVCPCVPLTSLMEKEPEVIPP